MDKKQAHLLTMLDFSHVKNVHEVREHAAEIAFEIMNNWELVSFDQTRRILALEFYLIIPKIFEDDSTVTDLVTGIKGAAHKRFEQLTPGCFYFHTKSKGEKWSPPIFNRHGVDITCGDKEKEIYGGILLRHLSGANNQDGSGRALRAILRGDKGFDPIQSSSKDFGWSEQELALIKKMHHQSIFDGDIRFVWAPLENKVELKRLTRIGIDKTKFANELLRFVVKS
ncbi:MAG: hypothetical protein H0V66_07695 [Bdellovibrionales bacterium]|nr:hypothetical protein [Bdellovibrionales bacterium]